MVRGALSPEDHRRVREAADVVESRTEVRIAVVITRISERYSLYALAGAALGAFTAGGFAIAADPILSGRALIFIELCVFFLLALLLDVPSIRMALVPERAKKASARSLAHREFAAHMIGDPPHRRILLFVSLAERYVEIIADHATHAAAPAAAWSRIVDDLIAAVKSDRIADGVIAAIEAFGAMVPQRAEPSEGI